MNKVLEIQFSGWTATPRMPFILSGSTEGGAVCLPTPTYSLVLGIIGCCLGRTVSANEVQIGFHYEYDSLGKDLEKRQRLQIKSGRLKTHSDGGDAYLREFHVMPRLTIWIDRLDWFDNFKYPIGTPALGRSQDILKIESVKEISVTTVDEAVISGCMLPFNSTLKIGGQLVQLAEAYQENDEVGSGRTATKTGIFIAIPSDNSRKLRFPNLFQTQEEHSKSFYLHTFNHG
jgi:CRISPR-associated protein Cas5t